MRRLRQKLLATTIALVVVTIAVSGVFLRHVTHDQVRRLLLIQHPPPALAEAARPFEDHVRAIGGWRDIDAVIERVGRERDCRVVLTNLRGEVIAASADLRAGSVAVDGIDHVTATRDRDGLVQQLSVRIAPQPIRDPAGRPIAHLYVLPPDDFGDRSEDREIAALDRRLIATFAIAMLVAVLLTVLVSRRITRPIEQLTAAVEQVGRGVLPGHVPVTGRDEIAGLATSFNAMVDAVALQEQVRQRMVGDIAHELRTPLTNLRCELEAIQDGLAAPDAERVSSIHEEVLHLQRLVEDLQDLAVADAGALILHRERIDLGAAIARIVGARAEVSCDGTFEVDADLTRLRQVVNNVLANALRHSPDSEPVRVRIARTGTDAAISVIDRGPGIPAGDLERIFERFYRVDEARGRDRGGAGLGLAIVRRLVELHGGRVWAESSAGAGATVTFTLPLASS